MPTLDDLGISQPVQLMNGYLHAEKSRETISRGSLLSEIYRSYGEDRTTRSRTVTPVTEAPGPQKANGVEISPLRLLPLTDAVPEESPPTSDNSAEAYLSNGSGTTTPVPQSPLTPKTTPPRATGKGFTTTTEPWRTTPVQDVDLPAKIKLYEDLSLRNSIGMKTTPVTAGEWLDATRTARLQSLDRESSDQSSQAPTSRLKHKPDVRELRSLSGGQQPVSHDWVEEWDPNLMRNVTLRNKKGIDPRQSQLQGSFDSKHTTTPPRELHVPKARRDTAQQTAQSRNVSDSSTQSLLAAPSTSTEMESFSSSSGITTIVEAMVVDHSPPQQFPKLRHVSKNDSLRSGPSRQSNRDSWNSDMRSSPPSVSAPLPGEKLRRSMDSDASTKGAPNTLRRRRDTIPLRASVSPEQSTALHPIFSMDADESPESLGLTYLATPTESSPRLTKTDRFLPNTSAVSLAPSATDGASDVFYDASSQIAYNQSVETLHVHSKHERGFSNDRHPRFSLEDGTKRVSLDPSFISERYHHARFSPMSVRSGGTDGYEVQEANAVNFYPHNNESLLVVQNGNHKDAMRVAEEGYGLGVISSQAESGTGEHNVVDCPLRNPREAPLPPAVTVIPPTPAKELDAQDEAAARVVPTHRSTLLRNVRRYSDTILQPFAGSLHRKSRGDQDGNRFSRRPNVSEQDSNLHPFWRPRHFWNDLSDSEDEDYESVGRIGPPSRGSGTHSEGNAKSNWHRGGSLRGFLIGNSLGLDRGPTNKRKPVIILPYNNKRYATTSRQEGPTSVRASARMSGSGKRQRSSSLTRLLQDWKEKRRGRKLRRDEEDADAQEERRQHLRSRIHAQVPSRQT